MSAQDNLSPKQFFHGTAADLSVGGSIVPNSPLNHAYFTDSPYTAYRYGAGLNRAKDPNPGFVYQVQPQGRYVRDTNEKAAYKSKNPLTIVGKDTADNFLNENF